jgi:UDP-2-acetamido-2-deoxy-ribo-hexuluronate aminotransferase
MEVQFYGHVRQYLQHKEEFDKAIQDVLMGGVYTLGPQKAKLEEELAAYVGKKYCIALNSGTDALWFALLAWGIGKGDEVITCSNSFFASAEAIWLVGATPVFVDSRDDTKNMDVSQLEAKITKKTKAIMPVHLYGQPAEMRKIKAIADKHGLKVIEDCAQAFGAKGDDFKLAELSDALATSFITAKNLGCWGDGGAIFTDDENDYNYMKKLHNHGSAKRSHHSVGYNSRLDEIQAAVLRIKLKYIDQYNDARIARANEYTAQLKGTKLQLPVGLPGYRHIYHLYVVETPKRDDLQAFLKSKDIIALTNYPINIHQQDGYPFGSASDPKPVLPNSEKNAAQCLSLPMNPEITSEEVKYVCDCVKEWDAKN